MSNSKNLDTTKNTPKRSRKSSNLRCKLALVGLLSLTNPNETNAITNINQENIEVVTKEDIINNIEKKLGVTLPTEYRNDIKNFVANNEVMKDKDGANFTENFIVKEMEVDRGISKSNQLLFLWDIVYEQITKKNIYNGDDGDEKRLAEFEKVMDEIEECGKGYNSGFRNYMRQKSAEARQQSAEARQQSAEARQQSAEARQQSAEARQQSAEALNSSLENLIRFYNRYKKNPSNIEDKEVKQRKEKGKEVIQRCKEFGINYKAKLSPEILKFYGIE